MSIFCHSFPVESGHLDEDDSRTFYSRGKYLSLLYRSWKQILRLKNSSRNLDCEDLNDVNIITNINLMLQYVKYLYILLLIPARAMSSLLAIAMRMTL